MKRNYKNNYEVHLTFKTDKETAWLLTNIAHAFNKTQGQLLDEICRNFVKSVLEDVKQIQNNKETTT